MEQASNRNDYVARNREGVNSPISKSHKTTYSTTLDTPDEGAFFGLNSDWGDGRSYPTAPPTKGSFFGLHSDFGKGYDYPPELDRPDEGAYFGLQSDWGTKSPAYKGATPNKGSFFGLYSDWGAHKDRS